MEKRRRAAARSILRNVLRAGSASKARIRLAISVYVYKDVLTLFALTPYDPGDLTNMPSHLTNTCRQVWGPGATAATTAATVCRLMDGAPV